MLLFSHLLDKYQSIGTLNPKSIRRRMTLTARLDQPRTTTIRFSCSTVSPQLTIPRFINVEDLLSISKTSGLHWGDASVRKAISVTGSVKAGSGLDVKRT